jgi:ubiquinone/menaquinone biosynthesis C-methylase UbiE
MIEKYVSNKEYNTYYETLSNLRSRIAKDLPVESNAKILDVGTGYSYFAIEIAKLNKNVRLTGIDISKECVYKARINVKKEKLQNRIEIKKMDAINMEFNDEEFDMVVNFTGLEDIHMSRGKTGVYKTFSEVSRVLKSNSYFCFVVMPPEEMETAAQRIEVELFSYICDATWLSVDEYLKMLDNNDFKLIRKKNYYTNKKLTVEQAKEEIIYSCDNDPKIYGVKTKPFDDVWNKFGEDIEKNGLGHYSKVILFIANKI